MNLKEDFTLDNDERVRREISKQRLNLAIEAARAAEIREFMASPNNRRVAFRLLEFAGVNRVSFVPGAGDQTSFNEGQRNVGLWLLGQLDPEEYALMMQENTDVA